MARKRYLIIGDGAAGITAAQTLRANDPGAAIGLLTDEPYPGYYRAALTNYLLGELREDQLWCVAPDFYDALRVQRLFARVTGIDVQRREIWDSSGSGALAYDALLLAVGARPRVPTFAGAHLPGVMTLRTIQDVRRIVERLRTQGARSAAVLGGGPLGLEWAHGLHEHGVKVTIIEQNPRFLPRVLDETASHLLVTRLERAGIQVVLGEHVAQAYPAKNGFVGAVTTHTGRAVQCEILAVATGVVPNTEFLRGNGIALAESGAVQVNRQLASSVPGIWAAGDCASVDGTVLQLWEPARWQGRIAAQNMLGKASRYEPGVFYFATRLFDLDFASVGKTVTQAGADVLVDLPRGTGVIAYRKLVFENGRLIGALLLGERAERVRAMGRAFKRLIDAKLDVSAIRHKLLEPGFYLDGWLGPRALFKAPEERPATAALAAAKLRGTQLVDFKSALKFDTQVLALAKAAHGTVAVPSAAPSASRGTRLLSIGLNAEAAPVSAPVSRLVAAQLELGGQRVNLATPLVRIGQAPECEVRLSDAHAALLHAEIVHSGGQLYLRDVGSHSGTWLNGQPVVAAPKLYDGDAIQIGASVLVVRAPELRREERATEARLVSAPRLEFRSGSALGLSFALGDEPRLIGRAPSAAIRIDELGVSLEHARIRGHAGAHYLCDLSSELGTWVGPNRLAPGQELGLAENTALRFGTVDAVYTRAPRPAATSLLSVRARLHVERGPRAGHALVLGDRTLIGSDPRADLCVPELAALQLEIVKDARGHRARDVAGGVFRSGAPLGTAYVPLEHGDLLLGPNGVLLRFEEAE